ncbi:hypothetical protein ABBQ32_006915 [Trebouxia sp. C0010 RCD-2024]
MEVPSLGLPDRLIRRGSKCLSQGKQTQDELLNGLNECLTTLLKLCYWPPPLANDPNAKLNPNKRPRPSTEGLPGVSSADGHSEAPLEDLNCPGRGGQGEWGGFDGAGPAVLEGLQQCVYALLACQQGVLASVNFPLDLLPMLDVVQTITGPLLAKLRFHFASGRPTDRVDQPDWLFETAALATEEHLESFKALQPAVQSHGLDKVFYLPFEFARAMHAAVQTVLREHVLPRLSQQGTQDLWTFYADSAVAFEKRMAILRGIYIDDSQMDHDGPFAWGKGSCLELVFARDAWQDAWLRAEDQDGQEQLADILDRPNAWDPSPSVAENMPYQQTLQKGNSSGKVAWQEEFWPTTAAEYVLHLLWTLSKRALWLLDPESRQSYVAAVPKNMMRTFRNRLGRLAKTAEDLRNMASPQWIPKVSAYINTCHYLEHHLRQSHLPLLLMHDSASLAPSPDRTRESTPVPPSPNPQPPAFTPNNLHLASPADGQQHVRRPTDPQIRANGGAGVGAYEAEAAAVGSFWKKWSLKLARAVVWQFEMDSRSYRYKSHLAEFSMTSYDREEGEEVVSPQLQRALIGLDDAVKLLSASMDAVVFRETWKAIAVAINRHLYNEVATETKFSHQGGRQLACDVQTLFSVFQPYTLKPAAHFKELRDASLLLAMTPDMLHALTAALHSSDDAGLKQLKQAGVLRLSPDQAISIIDQRV